MEHQQSKLEKVLGKLQQQIAQQAANSQTQIALLEVELEEAREQIEVLQSLVPSDVEVADDSEE